MTPEERDEGWGRIFNYRKWLLDKILKEGNIVVLPVEDGTPSNRENPPPYVDHYFIPIHGLLMNLLATQSVWSA